MKNDDFGDRFKGYEAQYRVFIPSNSRVMMRLDGKSFSKYTRGFRKPYDLRLMDAMDETTKFLCQEIQGVKMGFCQSDEITLYFDDLKSEETQLWFGGNISKMISISASMASAKFNSLGIKDKLAFFDSRVFIVPSNMEAYNGFLWRQQDCLRNAIQMYAQCLFSSKQLENKHTGDLLEMCLEQGRDFEDEIGKSMPEFKYGRTFLKESLICSNVEYFDARSNEVKIIPEVIRSSWQKKTFDFKESRDFLLGVLNG